MDEEKVVNRKVAIAIGIVCVVLLVVLVGNVYTLSGQISSLNLQVEGLEDENLSLKSEISARDNTIASLNSQIASLNSQIADLRDQKDKLQNWLQGNITYYTSGVNSLNSQIINLQNQIVLLNARITALNESYIGLLEEYEDLLFHYNLLNKPASSFLTIHDLIIKFTLDHTTYYYKDPVSGNVSITYLNGTAFKGKISFYVKSAHATTTLGVTVKVDGFTKFYLSPPVFMHGPGNYTVGISMLLTVDNYIVESRIEFLPSVDVEVK
ncbi:MAG: hypothetical protein QW717_03265 [Candidatus Bathyarchaeia archaeon]